MPASCRTIGKLARNLTLNLGLRYEYTTPYYGARPNVNINFDLKTGQLVTAKNPTDYLVNRDHGNIGPRIGVAWQIKPQKIVLRGGYGIFYSGEDMSGSDINLPLNPPQLTPDYLDPRGHRAAAAAAFRPHSLGIFRQLQHHHHFAARPREGLPRRAASSSSTSRCSFCCRCKSTFEVAYVGNRGQNLLFEYSLNQTPVRRGWQHRRQSSVSAVVADHHGRHARQSWYNSLQVKCEKRLTHGLVRAGFVHVRERARRGRRVGRRHSPQYLDNFAPTVDRKRSAAPALHTLQQRFLRYT